MRAERGFTVIELLVASAILLGLLAFAAGALHDALVRVPVIEEASDLQQRTRTAGELLFSELRTAGAGTAAGPLPAFFPAVLPRPSAAAPAIAVPDVLTLRYAPDDAPRARLASGLLPGDTTVLLDTGPGCILNAVACGFTSGMSVVLFDPAGNADTAIVSAIDTGSVWLTDHLGARTNAYGTTAQISEMIEVSYFHDAATRTLRREQNRVTSPVVDDVFAVEFRYLGTAGRPTHPRPPEGEANCLYAPDGTYLHPVVTPGSSLEPISLAELVDGPFCGAGRMAFDVDLLRIRAVVVRKRLETGTDLLRGIDPDLFARPGRARDHRTVPDTVTTFMVMLRHHGR